MSWAQGKVWRRIHQDLGENFSAKRIAWRRHYDVQWIVLMCVCCGKLTLLMDGLLKSRYFVVYVWYWLYKRWQPLQICNFFSKDWILIEKEGQSKWVLAFLSTGINRHGSQFGWLYETIWINNTLGPVRPIHDYIYQCTYHHSNKT